MTQFPRLIVAYTATLQTALGALLLERAVPLNDKPFPRNLTPAEHRAVSAYSELKNQKTIAHSFGIDRQTVNRYISFARKKAGCKTTKEMLALFNHTKAARVRGFGEPA